ncbi:MAG: cyclic nucleotide-binding domain-containing protein [Hyphomicrobiales bacterium]|nr:cyclic nucleotide-binding domain-containing protein [Hyphomicrobiales bacterium]
MRSEDLPTIRELPLFGAMEEENFAELVQAAYFQRFPPGVQLISEGEKADFLHIVVEGTVELVAHGNGRETVMQLVRPVETFILAAVVRDAVHLMSGRTVGRCQILMVPSQSIREIFARDAGFARSVVSELGGRYRAMVKALKNQKLRTAVERLANYLLRLEIEQGTAGRLTLPMEKRALASLLGMTPENLSRAFKTLAPFGVKVEGAEVRLAKRKDLEILAKPNLLIDDPDL